MWTAAVNASTMFSIDDDNRGKAGLGIIVAGSGKLAVLPRIWNLGFAKIDPDTDPNLLLRKHENHETLAENDHFEEVTGDCRPVTQADLVNPEFYLEPRNAACLIEIEANQAVHLLGSPPIDGKIQISLDLYEGTLPPSTPQDPGCAKTGCVSPIAPPLNPTQFTPLKEATQFLYTGENPVKTGVAPGTILGKRAAVVRGRVMDRANQPLVGVSISIKDHPELGQTLSCDDGLFDMAVNGGGWLTVEYRRAGYLPIQRRVNTPWRDYAWAKDVVMIPLDSQLNAISRNATGFQVAQGSVSHDADGERRATVLFPTGTHGTITRADGSTRPLPNTFHVRATEYTVGPNGPQAMPGPLPPTSGYTYAVELTLDEAGDNRVDFNQTLPVYVDNFLNFPTGKIVPLGWYDRDQAA